MSQIDSPSSLKAKDRAEYYKENQRAKEKYNSDLEAQRNRYEKSTNLRNEKFQSDISEIKDRYEKRFDELRAKSAENTKKFQSKMQNQSAEEQEENLRNLAKERDKFQKRIEELNVEYNKELSAKEKRHMNSEQMLKGAYKDNLLKKDEDFNQYTSNLNNKYDQATQELVKRSQDDKLNLEKKYSDILSDQTSSEMKKREMQNQSSSTVLNRTQADNKMALKLKEMEREAEVDDIRKETNARIDKRILDEKLNHERAQASHTREMEKQNDQHRRETSQANMDQLMEKRMRAYKEGRKEESLKRAQNNDISVTPKEQYQEVEIRRWKERNKAMEEKLGNQQESYSDNLKVLQNKNQMEAGMALQKKDVESDNRVMDVLAAERLKFDKSQSTWQSKTIADKEIHDRLTRKNEKTLKDRVTNLNETYTQRLQDLNDKNTNLLVGLKREHLHDKREFAINVETQFNKRQIDLVKDFEKKQDLLMTEYEKKISQLEFQNQELMRTMQENTSRIRTEGNQKLINQQDMLVEQKKDSERSLHELMASREKELRNTIYKLHEDYTKKINEQENNFKLRIKELARNYEQKMFHLQRSTNQEVNSKNNELVRERKTLLDAFQEEKKRLSDQYENVIKNMKTAHEEHMANLNRYKKINEKMSA